MKTVNIKTEILDYNLIVEGFVMSGVVHKLDLDFLDVDISEVPKDELEEIKDLAKEELLNHFYNPELSF